MIEYEIQLKIQAFLDGELTEVESQEVAALITSDSEASALHAELKNTRRALAGSEEGVVLDESREFYWSKIQREIEKAAPVTEPEPGVSLWQALSRLFKPVAATAVVVLLGYSAFLYYGERPSHGGGATEVLVASADAEAITFHDYSDDTTFVWFSYPAENGVANGGSATTLN